MAMKNSSRYWIPVFVYMALIFYLSSLSKPIPPGSLPQFYFRLDPQVFTLHVIEYSILGLLIYRAVKNTKYFQVSQYSKYFAVSFGIFYGFTDEVHQFFVPGRFACIEDMIANSLGVLAGYFLGKKIVS
jgi:VanZ family protein